MKEDNRWEEIDKAALHNALLEMKKCPRCQQDLQPVVFFEDVWGCSDCKETWHLSNKGKENP